MNMFQRRSALTESRWNDKNSSMSWMESRRQSIMETGSTMGLVGMSSCSRSWRTGSFISEFSRIFWRIFEQVGIVIINDQAIARVNITR
jgi:hypothetical protein